METTDKEFESIKSKILKLKALAERGEKGEAINAQRLLDKLLGQYGITLDEVIEKTEERKWYKFACRKKYEQKLLHQCYFKALNKNELQYSKGSGGIYYQLNRAHNSIEYTLADNLSDGMPILLHHLRSDQHHRNSAVMIAYVLGVTACLIHRSPTHTSHDFNKPRESWIPTCVPSAMRS